MVGSLFEYYVVHWLFIEIVFSKEFFLSQSPDVGIITLSSGTQLF